MMKSMITENGVNFKELEKNIYLWICQTGRQLTSEFLERYDRMLMEGGGTKADTGIRGSKDHHKNSVWGGNLLQGCIQSSGRRWF